MGRGRLDASGSGEGVASAIGLIAFGTDGGVLTGSAFSIRFGTGSFVTSPFDFGLRESPTPGVGRLFSAPFFSGSGVVFSAPAFVFGVGDSSSSGVGVFLGVGFFVDAFFDPAFFFCLGFGVGSFEVFPDFFVDEPSLFFADGDSSGWGVGVFRATGVGLVSEAASDLAGLLGFEVESLSFSSASWPFDFDLLLALGDSSGLGVGVFFAAGVGVRFGLGVGCFFDLALAFPVFGLGVVFVVSAGVGLALAFACSRSVFSASANSARVMASRTKPKRKMIPRKIWRRTRMGEDGKPTTHSQLTPLGSLPPQPHWWCALAPDEEWRLTFLPAAIANRSNTSMSST